MKRNRKSCQSTARRNRWAQEQRRGLIAGLGGRCRECGGVDDLEIDHPSGRAYKLHKLAQWQRVRFYMDEAARGLVRVLCRSCNASDGQRFRGDA